MNYWGKINGFYISTSNDGDRYFILNGIQIRQTRRMERMILFSLALGCLLVGCWNRIKERKNLKRAVICSAGVALFSVIPLLMPYLIWGVDLWFHLLRIEGVAQGLRAGQFPVRIQPDWMNGYGYPVSVFYGDGVLGIAELLRWIGFPLQTAYKVYVYVISFGTFMTAWYAFRRLFGEEKIALTGAAIYVLAPYRLVRVYHAGVGAYSALMFFPLIFIGVYEIMTREKKEKKLSWLLLAIGMSGVIQSHLLSGEIAAVIIAVTCIIFWKRTFEGFRFKDWIKAVFTTIFLNAGFLIPFLDYMRDDFKVGSDEFGGYIQTCGAFFSQLFSFYPTSGDDLSIVDGLGFQGEGAYAIGWVFLTGFLFFVIKYWKSRTEKSKWHKLGKYCAIASGMMLWMSTIYFPWDMIADSNGICRVLISKLQFPWRILGAASLFLTVLLCVVLKGWKAEHSDRACLKLAGSFIGISFLTAGLLITTFLQGATFVYAPDAEAMDDFDLRGEEYLLADVRADEDVMISDQLWTDSAITANLLEKKGTSVTLAVENLSDQNAWVEVPVL